MAVTVASVRADIRMDVEAAEPRSRPYECAITNAAGTGVTIGVPDGDAFQVGDLVETPSGELALVTAISTNDLTVTRAVRSITVETLSSGDIVKKNPRFSIEQIDKAYTAILLELNNRLFNLATEAVTYTVDDFYDVTDTAMEEVFTAWYIDDGDFYTPRFHFWTDELNSQPKIWLYASGYTGSINIAYRKPYTAVTELADQLAACVVAGAVYKLLGGAAVVATTDPGKRSDRTVQGGQEVRDSYWFFREYTRLRDLEVVNLEKRVRALPTDRRSQRARRYQP